MTAYAYICKRKKSQTLEVILRSLNFKYLDITIHNLPGGKILLEERIKRQIRKKIFRGKIEVYIFLKGPEERELYIEEKVLVKYLSQIKKIAKRYNLDFQLDAQRLLALPNVLYWRHKEKGKQLLSIIQKGLKKLIEFKEKEGEAIQREIVKNLQPLKRNIKEILARKPSVSREGNHREDIDEEISLISFYINKLEKKILSKDKLPKGKYLDFLTQEILRELNSASSKTKRKYLSLLIVEAKSYLDRIREQIQNIE